MSEQEHEYRQMAALSCDLIDLLATVAQDKTITVEELREQVNDIKDQKDELIANPAERERRYAAMCLVLAAASR